ncbi:alpha/beta fold hydrolase [Photobacterium sanguinicancri]|uniref:alpha/beta fold hydrolase n=1 Tax=Photobacterium sanguinicancri TaxID=875932 RepID=UPI0026E451D4|nr:alpha/beta hydrolase [Photobacterium sanguinicancri]MDO6496924.1 alpha/beta hydrolase [Photobacterium sanguinicancri]
MTTKSQYLQKSHGFKWWLIRVLISVFVIMLVAFSYLLFVGSSAKSKLIEGNPAPGRLVDVGGYKMHINCMGEGSPTVIMEAGAGDFSVSWAAVQPTLSQTTRVCSYDRAGFGWSEPNAEQVRTSQTMVQELETLLANANIDDRLVLVGHSFGGLNVRLFADRHLDRVAGVVLVDALHEDVSPEMQRINSEAQVTLVEELRVVSILQSIGLLALSPEEIPEQGLPPEAMAQYRAILATGSQLDTMIAELSAIENSLTYARSLDLKHLDNIPVAVLTTTHRNQPSLSEEQNKQMAKDWNKMQIAQSKLSSESYFVSTSKSGHYIQLEQPELVIRTINKLVTRARYKG